MIPPPSRAAILAAEVGQRADLVGQQTESCGGLLVAGQSNAITCLATC